MTENIGQMRERHQKEINQLQTQCKHEISDWRDFMWAPGHCSGKVKVCEWCGKIVENKGILFSSVLNEEEETS